MARFESAGSTADLIVVIPTREALDHSVGILFLTGNRPFGRSLDALLDESQTLLTLEVVRQSVQQHLAQNFQLTS